MPMVADIDADGDIEVIVGSAIIDGATGALLGVGGVYGGTANWGTQGGTTSIPADVDGDGLQEIVTGNRLYDSWAGLVWDNGLDDGFVAIGNSDIDTAPETIVTGAGEIRLQDDDGTVLWSWLFPSPWSPDENGPPALADVTWDGIPEVFVADQVSLRVVDGATGEALSWPTIQDWSSGVAAPVVTDLDGDGHFEVVYADEETVWIYCAEGMGVLAMDTAHHSDTWLETPSVADVDADGQLEVVVGGSAPSSGVRVLGSAGAPWVGGRSNWNQYAYSVDNIADDGSVPANPSPSWMTHNSFRATGPLPAPGPLPADLVPEFLDLCEAECGAGTASLSARVFNGGGMAPAGTVLAVRDGAPPAGMLLASQVLPAIPAGWASASVEFALPVPSFSAGVVRLADDGDLAAECNEADNVLVTGVVPCGP
jgi:hypothetical protein